MLENSPTEASCSGTPGLLEQVEIDTKHFLGNFPESCAIDALYTEQNIAWETAVHEEQMWTSILPRTKLGPDGQHYFELENVEGKTYTHVKVTIYPDGGIKRVRLCGRKAERLSGGVVTDCGYVRSGSLARTGK